MLELLLALSGSILPPERYDYEPNPSPIVWTLPQPRVNELCQGTSRRPVLACAYLTTGYGRCLIILPDWAPARGAIYRHERAHCNQWPKHHPK